MAIRMVDDLGAPVAVTAVDLLTEAAAPDWNEWTSYGMVGIGYLSAWMGWGGDFVKNIGIASFPWAAKNLYTRVRAGMGSEPAKKLAFRPQHVANRDIRQTTFPEYEEVRVH